MQKMNNSQDFMRECEAREVMKWPRDKRTAHYEAIKLKRGQAASTALVDEVRKQYRIHESKTAEHEL
jgi:hypothetical protein